MRTRDRVQVPLNLIHHLVGPSIPKRPPFVRLAFVAKAEDTLRGLAHQWKVVCLVLFRAFRGPFLSRYQSARMIS